jgi:hypothetical protein
VARLLPGALARGWLAEPERGLRLRAVGRGLVLVVPKEDPGRAVGDGQNFGWMVGHISGGPVFVGLGIGTELVALAILLAFFKRRGWF